MRTTLQRTLLFTLLSVLIMMPAAQAGYHPSYDAKVPRDTVPFYDTDSYNPAVAAPEQYLSQPIGKWPARFGEIDAYLRALAEQSDRIMFEAHGETHEGRELYHLIISTPENLAKLDEYIATMDRVADPAQVGSASELDELTEDLPAFCWLAYSIHGDEISGTDAATRLVYHLAAAQDEATMALLENLIILVDPCENPDGRERYLSMLEMFRSHTPNYDYRSLQHSGAWPGGRSNHYWFDLNRDWILLTQPETVGRVRSIVKYHPVLVVDGHEMGSNATFLFSPPRQPINYNTPDNVMKWYGTFAEDQAAAFDERGWPYYTGEWNEQWYIGYASAWPTFFGTVGILYEQAGVDGEFVKQRDEYLLTYHEAINHQFTSSLANLTTAMENRVEMLRDYHNARADIVERGRRSGLTFLFGPDEDQVKMNRFISSLIDQGIEVEVATETFTASSVTNPYHEKMGSKEMPSGTYIISTDQPHGALAKGILEFDLHLKKEFLEEERRELEKHGDTRMYETSSWSVPLLYDLDAYYTNSPVNAMTEPVTDVEWPTGMVHKPDARYAFIVDMVGENTWKMLNRLFAEELTIYASEKEFTIEGKTFRPGALVLRTRGNPKTLESILQRLAEETGAEVHGVNTGFSMEGSHLGAPTFRLLQRPNVALAAGSPVSSSSSGSLWFVIDKQLELPHSLIETEDIGRQDLSPYNTLILPGSWWGNIGRTLGEAGEKRLEDWVSDGGTLILIGSSAVWAADSGNGLSQARLRKDVLDKLDEYKEAIDREIAAESPEVDTMAIWHPDKVPADEEVEEKGGGHKISKEKDKWLRRFHPRGVIMRADLDTEHWLNFGLGDRLPVLVWTDDILYAKAPVSTVARLSADPNELRLSGLLWPEARQLWSGSAFVTRESKGKGQVIMFMNDPNFRAYTYGTRAMFINAIMYGPGFTRGFSPYQQN